MLGKNPSSAFRQQCCPDGNREGPGSLVWGPTVGADVLQVEEGSSLNDEGVNLPEHLEAQLKVSESFPRRSRCCLAAFSMQARVWSSFYASLGGGAIWCAGDESLLRRGLSAGSDRNCWRAGSLAEGDFHTPDAVTVAFLLVLLSVRYFVEFLYECRINVNNNNQTPQACAVSAHHICPCDVSASCRAAELRVSRPAPISP